MILSVMTGAVLSTITDVLSEAVEVEQKIYSWGELKTYLSDQIPAALDFLLNLIIAVIVLLIGIRIIKLVRKLVRKALAKTALDEGLKQFIDNILNLFLYFVLIMIILANFGITASSVIAIVGSVGLSIGLALQGTLSNFAGGVLILLLKPFKVGDYILEDTHGNEGTVSEIQLFYTKLVTVDNRTVVLPNGTLSNCSLTNYTHQNKRMLEIITGVSYEADLKLAKQVISDVVMNDPARLAEEETSVFVSELAESSVNIGMRVWVKTADFFPAKWRITENIKLALDENGIEIPYPQMHVTLNTDK
ncbi:MAG: mechanosensitive ion channel [Eubacterium sp.]|nr:mechanosensitive ion channel [Eubacterium sp.]